MNIRQTTSSITGGEKTLLAPTPCELSQKKKEKILFFIFIFLLLNSFSFQFHTIKFVFWKLQNVFSFQLSNNTDYIIDSLFWLNNLPLSSDRKTRPKSEQLALSWVLFCSMFCAIYYPASFHLNRYTCTYI